MHIRILIHIPTPTATVTAAITVTAHCCLPLSLPPLPLSVLPSTVTELSLTSHSVTAQPRKVADAFAAGDYVPYNQLTTKELDAAGHRQELVFTEDGALVPRALDGRAERSISVGEWLHVSAIASVSLLERNPKALRRKKGSGMMLRVTVYRTTFTKPTTTSDP